MDRKSVQKELADICRKWFKEHNCGSGRVEPYKDLSVECYVYGNRAFGNHLKEYLRQFPEFHEIGLDLCWTKENQTIYITIV